MPRPQPVRATGSRRGPEPRPRHPVRRCRRAAALRRLGPVRHGGGHRRPDPRRHGQRPTSGGDGGRCPLALAERRARQCRVARRARPSRRACRCGCWAGGRPSRSPSLVGLRDDLLLMSPDWLFHDPWYVAGATDVLGMDVAAAEVRWNGHRDRAGRGRAAGVVPMSAEPFPLPRTALGQGDPAAGCDDAGGHRPDRGGGDPHRAAAGPGGSGARGRLPRRTTVSRCWCWPSTSG